MFKKNQIVEDDRGNAFRVIAFGLETTTVESVVTKEVFEAPTDDLRLTTLTPRG